MKKSRNEDDLLMQRNFKTLSKEDLMTHRKLPKGGLGLEKGESSIFKDKILSKTKDSNNLNDKSIQCHTCKYNMICKYQGDYLEQIVHIVDLYNGAFELNCNYYEDIQKEVYKDKTKEEWEVRYDNKVHKFSDYISALSFSYDLFENGEEYQFYKITKDSKGIKAKRIQ